MRWVSLRVAARVGGNRWAGRSQTHRRRAHRKSPPQRDSAFNSQYYKSSYNMGNHYICGGNEEEQGEILVDAPHTGAAERALDKRKEEQNKSGAVFRPPQNFLQSLPAVSDELLEALTSEKPFQRQIQQQPSMQIVKLNPTQIYNGPLDQSNQPQGWGKVYMEDGSVGVGNFRQGKPTGQHYLFLPDGSFYRGMIATLSPYTISEGEYTSQGFKYRGYFKDNEMHGRGSQHHKDYDFEGEYCEGKRVKGVLKWRQKNFANIYRGTFGEHELFQGQGELETREGVYRGSFVGGMKEGEGVFEYANGLTYQGTYKGGERNGKGKIINSDQSICYEGSFYEGMPHGWGRSWDEEGRSWEGEFKFGIGAAIYDKMETLAM